MSLAFTPSAAYADDEIVTVSTGHASAIAVSMTAPIGLAIFPPDWIIGQSHLD
jgi:hypothetical protein